MTTKPDLDDLLLRLAALQEQAQRIYEEQQREEYFGWEPEYQVWLSLECDVNDMWLCGWRVQQDESTVWAFHMANISPVEAAQALLKEMQS